MKSLNNLLYKRKNQLLLLGTFVFLFICYQLAFKSMFTLMSEVNMLEKQLLLARDVDKKITSLQVKLAELERMPGLKQSPDSSIQQQLLGLITDYCQKNEAVLREFPKTVSYDRENYRIETNVFVLEGTFVKLLGLIYMLEQKNRVGKIASVLYSVKKDIRTKSRSLTATIYLQNIKKVYNEK